MRKPGQKSVGGVLLLGVVYDYVTRKFFPELAKELFYGPLGDWLRSIMPVSASEYVMYVPITLVFVAGVMAVTGWGMNTTVHISRPFFRRKSTTSQKTTPINNDHWTERKQLEIYVLANVSVGRDSADTEIKKEPELSRLRELKDAITLGELDATINGERPNVRSTVSFQSFQQYVAATNKSYWVEILQRWQARQNYNNSSPDPEIPLKYLEYPSTGISIALLVAVMESPWGKRCRGRSDGTEAEKIGYAMGQALHFVQSAARNGDLEIRGQIPGTTKYEIIQPDTWAHAPLMVTGEFRPDIANPFKVEITAGNPPNPKLERALKKEMSYDSLDVNSRQFEALIDSLSEEESSKQTGPRFDTPIHEAVEYVARKIDDYDSDKCYPSARRELRKAAFDGDIKMHGKRELKEGHHSDLTSPIPQDFWDDQELNALATSVVETHKDHTQAEMSVGFETIGERKEKYWDVRISMDEVKRIWP